MSEQQADPALEERPRVCQAQGCEVDVNPCGRYCRKTRLCPEHLKATSLCREKYGDEKWRFCQQCGKLELLVKFDGMKRSCREQLARRRTRVNSTKGERRRSYGTEPSHSIDRTSSEGSERLSEDGGAAVGPLVDPAAAAAAPVAAAGADCALESALAAAREASDAAVGVDPLEGQSSGDAAAALAAALGGTQPCHLGYLGLETGALPYGVDLATYQQYGINDQPMPAQQQQAEGQMLQQGPKVGQLLSSQQQQQQQQGMLGLQQQQVQLMLPQHEVNQPVAPGAVLGAAVSSPESSRQLQSLLAAAAHAGNRSASSEVLFQLIREQQMLAQLVQDPDWQQPVVTLPSQGEPPHADVYPTGHGSAAGAGYSFFAGSLDNVHAEQASAQQQQEQEQQSVLQQVLLDHHRHQQQQQLGVLQQCLMQQQQQQQPSLVHRSRSAGGAPRARAAPAGYACFMGMASAASEPAMNTAMDAAMNAALSSDASGGFMRTQLPAGANQMGQASEWFASEQGSYAAGQAVNSMPALQAADAAAGASLDQSFPVQQQQQQPHTMRSLPLQLQLPDQQAQQQQAQPQSQQPQRQQQLMPQQQGVAGPEDFNANASWVQDQDPDPSDFSLDDLDDLLVAAGAGEAAADPVAELRSLSAAQKRP